MKDVFEDYATPKGTTSVVWIAYRLAPGGFSLSSIPPLMTPPTPPRG